MAETLTPMHRSILEALDHMDLGADAFTLMTHDTCSTVDIKRFSDALGDLERFGLVTVHSVEQVLHRHHDDVTCVHLTRYLLSDAGCEALDALRRADAIALQPYQRDTLARMAEGNNLAHIARPVSFGDRNAMKRYMGGAA